MNAIKKPNILSNIKDRAMHIADVHYVGRKKFAEQIGMTYSSFTGAAKGTPLNSKAVENILSDYPAVNAEWLMTGKGEVLKNTDETGKENGVSVQEDRKVYDEIMLSQQRTIEKLVDLLKK